MAITDRFYGLVDGRVRSEGRMAHYLDRQYEALSGQVGREVAEHLGALDDATLVAHGIDPKSVIHVGGKVQ